MQYLILSLIILLSIVLILNYYSKKKQKELLKKIRAAWGNPKIDNINFNKVENYSKLIKEKYFHELSEQTLVDTDFYELFKFVDRTTSKIGQQYLFSAIKKPTNSNSTLQQLSSEARFFADNKSIREEVQQEIIKLDRSDAYHISSLLSEKLIQKPYWFRFLFLDTALVIMLLGLLFWSPVFVLFLFIPLTINIFLHYWNKSNSYQFMQSFPQLNQLIVVSKRLLQKDIPVDKHMVEESALALKPFQRKLRLLSLGQDGSIKDELSQFGFYVIEIIKALFLIELYALFNLVRELENKQAHIEVLFRFVGKIDTAISIASLRAGSLKTCEPNLTEKNKKLTFKNIYHPLVIDCVANNINVNSKSILITGSNMSGKTTFLRSVAVNTILAQSIYTCFADRYEAPFMKLFSSIRIDDNLLTGKSFYLEEVNVMGSLISEVKSDQQNIFILDEVFKGTNTIERIASAKAILSYLNKFDNVIFVSTHDIELAKMLVGEFDLYHFTEIIDDSQLCFDHELKVGPLKTKNAIKILEISGFPSEIINEAKDISEELAKKN